MPAALDEFLLQGTIQLAAAKQAAHIAHKHFEKMQELGNLARLESEQATRSAGVAAKTRFGIPNFYSVSGGALRHLNTTPPDPWDIDNLSHVPSVHLVQRSLDFLAAAAPTLSRFHRHSVFSEFI